MPTESFEEFWIFYLSVHQRTWTRRFHAAATVLGCACVLMFPLTLQARWLVVGPLVGYPIAWFSHYAFEGKPPAMLAGPLWALMCDFRMVRLMFLGQLDAEWERVQATGGTRALAA